MDTVSQIKKAGLFFLASPFLLVAISGCTGNNSGQSCVPGATQACVGAGGCSGGQICNQAGNGFEACDCGLGGGSGDGGTGETADFCGIIKRTVNVCNGQVQTVVTPRCATTDSGSCDEHLPLDEDTSDDDPTCYTRTRYKIYLDKPVVGTCDEFKGWWNDEIDCFLDQQCPSPVGGAVCVANNCICPDGVNCDDCQPVQPFCDGDVQVKHDRDVACNWYEVRVDCAAEFGAICNPDTVQCEDATGGGGTPDAGPGPTPDAGAPGGGSPGE